MIALKTKNRSILLFLTVLAVCLLLPERSMALQAHGEPEGMYVHQMAHILYMAALGYLYWDTQRSAFSNRGWTYLRIFCVLTIFWNLLALIGHEATQYIHPKDITVVDGYLFSKVNKPLTLIKAAYYTAKLDHLLTVPAMFFLYIALRSFYQASLKEDDE
jgi:hypothetical protein